MNRHFKVLLTIYSIFICTIGIAQEDKNYRETPLTDMEIKKLFPAEVLQQIGVEFPIFRVYPFEDKDGKQYLILTEKVTKGNIQDENSLKRSIKAFNVSFEADKTVKVRWTITDYIDKERETSIWFWSRYLRLKDLDNDGFVDPIVVYGTKSIYGDHFEEGRVKILIYHLGKKIVIRHQNSEMDDARHTQVDKSFYVLPLSIKKKVYDIIDLLEDNGHSLFNSELKDQIKNSLKIQKNTTSFDKGETIDEFLQRAKKAASSDAELQKMINFPLRVRGVNDKSAVFEDKFYSFAEIKDNVMLYEGTFKAGLLSAVSISRGDCRLFTDKNCFVIKSTEIGLTEVVLLKKGKRYIIVGIEILGA